MKKRINLNFLNSDYLYYIGIIGIGIFLISYATSAGLILTDDSINYLHSASSFRAVGQFLSPNGTPASSWPPLFSMILSWMPSPARLSINFFSVLVFFLNCILLIRLTKTFFKEKFFHVAFVAIAVLSVSQIMIHTFLWSEPFFISLLLILLLALQSYLKGPNLVRLIVLILLINLLCLHRNAGIFVLPGVAASILFYSKQKGVLFRALLFGLFGSLVFVVWNIYSSYYFSDGFDFLDNNYLNSFGLNIYNTLNVVSAWIIPRIVFAPVRVIALVVTLLIIFPRIKLKIPQEIKPLLLVILSYLFFLNIIGQLQYFEIERYLSVIYSLIILMFFHILSQLAFRAKSKWVRPAIVVFILVWGGYVTSRSAKNATDWHKRSNAEQEMSQPNYGWLDQ